MALDAAMIMKEAREDAMPPQTLWMLLATARDAGEPTIRLQCGLCDARITKRHKIQWLDIAIPMHTACFVCFSGLLETEVNLKRVFSAWLQWVGCSSQGASQRKKKALDIVYNWLSTEHYVKIAETRYKEYWRRFCFRIWAVGIASHLSDSESDIPGLRGSSDSEGYALIEDADSDTESAVDEWTSYDGLSEMIERVARSLRP